MNFIILGGTNNEKGELNNFTKMRILKCNDYVSTVNTYNHITIHFSGGLNKKFNNTDNAHCNICQTYFYELNNKNKKYNIELHINNNNTVEEAIHFGNYFKNSTSEIKIITNDWHRERVKYLFDKVFNFYNINNYEIIDVESTSKDDNLILEENNKIKELKENPYGLWKNWLTNYYYIKNINLRLVNKNESDGKLIVNMRNENNNFFFDKEKFYWKDFKEVFYQKYFSNELPPFFVIFEENIIGFIGCKTIEKNVNDIGIMFFKKYQNCGFGKVSLKKFLELYNNNNNKIIIAKILKHNIGSYKIFLANHFILHETNTTNEMYYLTYKLN